MTTTEMRNRPAAHGPESSDHLDGDHHNDNPLRLPRLDPEVAARLEKMDQTNLARNIRIMVRGSSARQRVRVAGQRVAESANDLDTPTELLLENLLDLMRTEFTEAADEIKQVIG